MLVRCCRIAAILVSLSAGGCAAPDAPSGRETTFAPDAFCRDVIRTLATGDKAGAERVFRKVTSPEVDRDSLKADVDKTVDAVFRVIAMRTNGLPLGYAETLAMQAPPGQVARIERWQSRNAVNIYFGCGVRDQPGAGGSRIYLQLSDSARAARRSMEDFHRAGRRPSDGIDV